jgi:Protein of unknown function (DUF2829)
MPEAWGKDFGAALSALKSGRRVCRSGWNGKGMWLSLTPGMKAVSAHNFWSPNNAAWAMRRPEQAAEVLPYITMKTADDKIVPWLASQTDILAEDWEVLHNLYEDL